MQQGRNVKVEYKQTLGVLLQTRVAKRIQNRGALEQSWLISEVFSLRS